MKLDRVLCCRLLYAFSTLTVHKSQQFFSFNSDKETNQCATAWYKNIKTQWEKWEHIPQKNAGTLTSGSYRWRPDFSQIWNFECWDKYITTVKPQVCLKQKTKINAIEAHVNFIPTAALMASKPFPSINYGCCFVLFIRFLLIDWNMFPVIIVTYATWRLLLATCFFFIFLINDLLKYALLISGRYFSHLHARQDTVTC